MIVTLLDQLQFQYQFQCQTINNNILNINCDGMAFPLHVTGKKQKNNHINKDGAMKPPT